jgi:hypothetical protein
MRARAVVAVAAAIALAGCASTWGFRGGVYALVQPPLDVLAIDGGGDLVSDRLVPIAGATITCDRCRDRVITAGADGRFYVYLGTGFDAPGETTLHVTAPGYAPIDVELDRTPHDAQVGYAAVVIVMAAAAAAPVAAR